MVKVFLILLRMINSSSLIEPVAVIDPSNVHRDSLIDFLAMPLHSNSHSESPSHLNASINSGRWMVLRSGAFDFVLE